MDVEMVDADVDMGYEYCAPQVRRGSMTLQQEKERRASIKAVMADSKLSPATKRRSIQHLMDGRRNSVNSVVTEALSRSGSVASIASQAVSPGMTIVCLPCDDDNAAAVINNEQTRIAEQSRPFCSHYARKCTMIAPCCGRAFGCRICHDECPDL